MSPKRTKQPAATKRSSPRRKQNPSRKPSGAPTFKLTYATMFSPPEEAHTRYESALQEAYSRMGHDVGMWINGRDRFAQEKFEDRSPINSDYLLGLFQRGTSRDIEDAIAAAKTTFPAWSARHWRERVRILREAARLIEERVYLLAAVVSLEVGKNRMEALGDVQETADLIAYACDQMEANNGYAKPMAQDPLKGYAAENLSVLRPYGVWAVISPFNFPAALAGGPVGAALVAGNCVLFKPASDTPWIGRLLAECFRDAGVPSGAIAYLTGGGSSLGEALIRHKSLDGITFTGSFDVGMGIYRAFAEGAYPRPAILEMGGKNPAIVSRKADLSEAVTGILRSAFGLQGQKCSACSRIYVEKEAYGAFREMLVSGTRKLTLGDPTRREVILGPVINQAARDHYLAYVEAIKKAGVILVGGSCSSEGSLAKGYYCSATVVEGVPPNHLLWQEEMFLPIAFLHAVDSLDEAVALANASRYGLTAGFYGSEEEASWFFDRIQSGVAYANRPQGATTGAWPGFQPFGGWKASGSSGKNAGGWYYLPLYMHEQIQTRIRKIK